MDTQNALTTVPFGIALPSGDTVDIDIALENDPKLVSAHTRRGYRHDLERFEVWRDNRPMTKMLVEQYAAHLRTKQGISPASVNRSLAAIRWLARRIADYAYEQPLEPEKREEILTQSTRVAEVEDVKAQDKLKGRELSSGEINALLDACNRDKTIAGVRDAAIISMFKQTGARRDEIAKLDVSDFKVLDETEGEITIKHGKGDKQRPVYIDDGAFRYVSDWLQIRGNESGPLFKSINKVGKIQAHGITADGLAKMLDKRAKESGVENLTLHDFRRTFVSILLDNGVDIVTVSKLMGHADISTTGRYDRRDEQGKRKAIKALHVPYKAR